MAGDSRDWGWRAVVVACVLGAAPVLAGSARPTPAPALLSLRSQPWARVIVDGADTGKSTPVLDLAVPAGRRTVRLVHDASGKSVEFTLDVAPGARVRGNYVLQ